MNVVYKIQKARTQTPQLGGGMDPGIFVGWGAGPGGGKGCVALYHPCLEAICFPNRGRKHKDPLLP